MNFEILEIKKLNTKIEKMMNNELEKIGLTYAQSTIIAYLYESTGSEIHQKDIENILGLSHPTVSGILKRMEKDKLIKIKSQDQDKRFNIIKLEQKSNDLFDEINDIYTKVKRIIFSNFTNEDRKKFNEYVSKLIGINN